MSSSANRPLVSKKKSDCCASAGAASYRVYGRTGGAAGLTGYVAGASFPIVDTGASLTSAPLPLEGTEAGNAPVVRFTASGNHYICQELCRRW